MSLYVPPPYLEPTFPVDRNDPAALAEYHTLLTEARVEALDNPLTSQSQFTLSLAIPSPNVNPKSRPLPDCVREYVQNGSTSMRIQLVRGIQTGADQWSQVWTAVPFGHPPENPIFIMKFIQPSLCPIDVWSREYRSPEDIACREAWMYGNLNSKQGLSAPYFYGVHEVETPSQELAWVLVIEYIVGQTLHKFCALPKKLQADDCCTVLDAAMHALADITSTGFRHYGLRPPNILITGPPACRGVVFIDFYDSEWDVEDYPGDPYNGLGLELYLLFFDGFPEPLSRKIAKWARANLPPCAWSIVELQ